MTLKTTANALITSAMLSMPLSGCYSRNTMPAPSLPTANILQGPKCDTFQRPVQTESPLIKGVTRTMKIDGRGNIISGIDSAKGLPLLAAIMQSKQQRTQNFVPPIDTALNPYIDSDGVFGAPKGILPNLGIDISIPCNAKPAVVLATTNGVIVETQTPHRGHGKQGIAIMDQKGTIYDFKFNTKDAHRYYRKLGTEVKEGDTLGLITAQKDKPASILHVEVLDMNTRAAQGEHPTWRGLNEYFQLPIKGQINPLEANGFGTILKKLPTKRGKILPVMKELRLSKLR